MRLTKFLAVAILILMTGGLRSQDATAPLIPQSQPQTQLQSQTQIQPALSLAEMEELLRTAKVIKEKWLGTGVTNPRKLTLTNGKIEFHAMFKTIDERKTGMTSMTSGSEMDFKDSWKFEVAAYELDKMLGLNMVPVTVERIYDGKKGAIQWWVENAMTERDRYRDNIKPPNLEEYNRAIFKIRAFDNLVYNFDRNLGNFLYDPAWKVWMIDHSRCFKIFGELKAPGDLTRFSRSMMEALRKLDQKEVKKHCGKYLTVFEIQAMFKRRDAILKRYDQLAAEKGESILFP